MNVNFFWRGDKFSLIHRITVLSHLLVGHRAIIWLSGPTPNSSYWIKDIEGPIVRNANEIFNVEQFINSGGNLKTASDLWSFWFCYKTGELYCDLDAVALKPFPDDEWMILSGEVPEHDLASIGIIRTPQKEPFLKEAIDNALKVWGNVKVFSKFYKKHYGSPIKLTHDTKQYYPFTYKEKMIMFEDKPIPDTTSIHIYHNHFDKNNIFPNRGYIKTLKDSMLWRIVTKISNAFDKKQGLL